MSQKYNCYRLCGMERFLLLFFVTKLNFERRILSNKTNRLTNFRYRIAVLG